MFAEFLETHGKSVNELINDDESAEEESDKETVPKEDESESAVGKEANKEISDLDVIWSNLGF